MKRVALAFIFSLLTISVYAQNSFNARLVKVFLDGNFIDRNYIKDNLSLVNYVRDYRDAEVYVLSITQRAGNGGETYFLIIEGQKQYAGKRDTIKFTTLPGMTFEEKRKKMLSYLTAGLMPYIAKSAAFENIDMTAVLGSKENIGYMRSMQATDTWRNWVFTLSSSGSYREESSVKSSNINGSFRASKVTQDLIIDFNSHYSYSHTVFMINPEYTVDSYKEQYFANLLSVFAIDDHWSWGLSSATGHTTYKNLDLFFSLKPAIEYNLYPYSEATVRQLRFLYKIGMELNYYIDTTIYNEISELLYRHELSVAYRIRKKWGNINMSLNASNYLHDFSKNSLRLNTNLSFRVVKGMSLWLSGGVGLIHDQLYLPRGGASLEEILTRQQQLATQYTYRVALGFSYTFGATYNNIVNPRFGRG